MTKKGIVVESGEGWAILMLKNGDFKKIKTGRRLYEGEVYTFSMIPAYKSLATAAVLILMLTFSLNFFPVAAYASFSSGVELGVNRWGQIVYMKITSTEGEQLVEGLDLWGYNIEKVLPEILDRVVALEEDTETQQDIVIEIRGAKANDKEDQPALEKINRVLASHNSNVNGHWKHKVNETQWRWITDEKESDMGSKQDIGTDNEQSSENADDGRKNSAKHKNRSKEEKDQAESNGSGHSNKEGNQVIQPPLDSGQGNGDKDQKNQNKIKPDSSTDKDHGGSHDKNDAKRKNEKNNNSKN